MSKAWGVRGVGGGGEGKRGQQQSSPGYTSESISSADSWCWYCLLKYSSVTRLITDQCCDRASGMMDSRQSRATRRTDPWYRQEWLSSLPYRQSQSPGSRCTGGLLQL